ncbi:MAG: hypothetical protein ABEJ78_10680 [Haloferacaceae archaeon]
MACPQCGGALLTYALGGREASVCEDCGYVGIDADHGGEPVEVESWDDALRRFYAEHGEDADPRVEVARDDVAERRRDGESWDDALERFYAEHGNVSSADDGADDERTADDQADDSPERERETATDDGTDSVSSEESGTPASQSSADDS